MARRERALTPWQVETYRMVVPQLIRAAFYGEELSGMEVSAAPLGRRAAAVLCWPLTQETLARMRLCVSVSWQDVDVIYQEDKAAEQSGRMVFRVRYEFDGADAADAPVRIREQAVIAVCCTGGGTGVFGGKPGIAGVEPFDGQADDAAVPLSPGQARKQLEKRSVRIGAFAGECCLEGVLDAIVEILLNIVGDIFDGL